MSSFKRLIHDIHRRSLWQVVSIYLVGSWISYQVILGLTDGLGLPAWVPPFAFVLFLIGLPIVLATAFVQEGPPQREDFRRGSRVVDGRAADPGPDAAAGAPPKTVPAPSTRAPSGGLERQLTWSRALLGGVLAFALLGAGTTGWVGMRALGIGPAGSLVAAGVIDARKPILIADFQGAAQDSAVAALVSEAFRIDLARSTLVRTVEPNTLRDVLRRMERPTDTPIDAELALEIALRGGYDAYLTGEVVAVGTGHVISARLIATEGGATLAALRETARDSSDLVPAIDRLSRALRERTGESLRTIRHAPPLEQVTTSSLQALRKYTEGVRAQTRQFDPVRALELYREAVALDTAFAAAWRHMAAVLNNRERRDEAREAIEQALRHQHRLSDLERELAFAQEASIRRDYPRMIAAYERALRQYPTNVSLHNNLAFTYFQVGQLERAAHHYRLALDVDSGYMLARNTYAHVLLELGQPDEARRTWEAGLRIDPTITTPLLNLVSIPGAFGDYARSEREVRAQLNDVSLAGSTVRGLYERLRYLLLAQGRYAEAAQVQAELPGVSAEEVELENLLARFWTELEAAARPDRAHAAFARLRPLLERGAVNRKELGTALVSACAAVRDVACARRALEQVGYGASPEPGSPLEHFELYAEVAVAQGDTEDALRYARAAPQPRCRKCFELIVAAAFLGASEPDSAVAAYERYLASPSVASIYRAWQHGAIHERIAEHYASRGDAPRAAQHYSRVIELWERADPELQPRVEAARRGLERLRKDS